ncbi:MAG: 2-hydroxyacyl-CoA dehydratase family protein [Nitrospiraceae bacterium]|nr:2-hydroxyacyl-CoA dehydratase family protein [Nitrospiraceae bacterium]
MSGKDYTKMWEGLGLNLENHAGLLGVLSKAYKDIYLAQKDRPRAMDYFDFVISEVHGLRIEEILKAKGSGRKVVGTFCVYVPEEIVLAADGVCIGLCAGAEVGSDEAEKFIPWKLHAIIEGSGAVAVGEESCIGERNHRDLLDENFSGVEEAMEKLASRYLGIDCACFTPNTERLDNIKALTKSLKADGVIHYSLQFCTPYMMEAYKAEKAITEVPFMRMETDYSMEDFGQLKTRVEAFIEMLR